LSRCEDIRPRLAAFLDGEVEDPAEIEAHLRDCPECGRVLEEHKRVSRLVSLVPAPPAGPDAWSSVEPRLRSFWGARSYALVPAAAVALVAAALYLFYLPGDLPRPVGTFAHTMGSVQIRPLSENNWQGITEAGTARLGDAIRTGSEAAARMELLFGGRLYLDRNTEIRFLNEDSPVIRLELLSGRTCIHECARLRLQVADMEVTGGNCCYVTAIEEGHPVVYVRSGRLDWFGKKKSGSLDAMQVLDFSGGGVPAALDGLEVFQWVEPLSERGEY
jgi:hypothetical protein